MARTLRARYGDGDRPVIGSLSVVLPAFNESASIASQASPRPVRRAVEVRDQSARLLCPGEELDIADLAELLDECRPLRARRCASKVLEDDLARLAVEHHRTARRQVGETFISLVADRALPLVDDWANVWAGLTGGAVGALAGLITTRLLHAKEEH
jgi:hypothetical protein